MRVSNRWEGRECENLMLKDQTELSCTLERQLDIVKEFDLKVEFLKRKDNSVADAFSKWSMEDRNFLKK